ncbi:hypothetical protein EDD85DRAFT_797934 [Armillaria nabsnona]|nr:hypothetical protein EDD85DRAFT_797934 [Armillaria nabsnona]
MAVKQSKLVWSLPIQCKLFLLGDLDPDLWYKLRTGESSQNSDISDFSITIERLLKSVADKDWDRGHPAQICIDNIGRGQNTNKSTGQLKTLVLPTTIGNNEILHKDICLLANHWKHESAKNWLKVLCVLDGMAFHIWLLRYHNGIEQTSLWQRFIADNYNHPDVQMIMGDNEMMKRFKKNLPQWKQAFENAVAISPLVLIMGQGMGQILNTPLALQVGGQLSSMGKPKLILHIEEILWKYIVGIAWGSWTSEVRLGKFLAEVEPLVTRMQVLKAASKDATKKGWVGYEGEDT